MKIAIIGDIHANLPALDAVLTDIKQHNVDLVVSTGDIVGYLPYPNEVIDRLRQEHVLVIQGNHDARFHDAPVQVVTDSTQLQASASFVWTNQTLTEENRHYLMNLPTQLQLQFANESILLVHGSHRRNNEYVYPEQEQLQLIAEEITQTIFISGHTHEAYVREVAGKKFINPGSVGKPKIPSQYASYAVLTLSSNGVQTELATVAYDSNTLCHKIVATDGIDSKLQTLFIHGE